jgi:hypothetical protein
MDLPPSVRVAFTGHIPGQLTIVGIPTVAKCPIVIDIRRHWFSNAFYHKIVVCIH